MSDEYDDFSVRWPPIRFTSATISQHSAPIPATLVQQRKARPRFHDGRTTYGETGNALCYPVILSKVQNPASQLTRTLAPPNPPARISEIYYSIPRLCLGGPTPRIRDRTP
jgi:hypothetical protein